MDRNELLQKLPPFQNYSQLIEKNQNVSDIVNEVCEAHAIFAKDYDAIAADFEGSNIEETCRNIFNFCKRNIRYKIETEKRQTSRSPSAIIAIGEGDCR